MAGYDAVDGSSIGTRVPSKWVLLERPKIRRSQIMQTTTTIGLDIAKSVFQVHGIDGDGNVVVRRQLKRRYVLTFFQKLPPCLVGIEACASSHYWSRELQALGHTVRLMPPAYDRAESKKTQKIRLPLGITTKSDFLFRTAKTRSGHWVAGLPRG